MQFEPFSPYDRAISPQISFAYDSYHEYCSEHIPYSLPKSHPPDVNFDLTFHVDVEIDKIQDDDLKS